VPIAEHAALVAIRADSDHPGAHHALGYVYLFTRRFNDLLAEFELALRLNPNFSRWPRAIMALRYLIVAGLRRLTRPPAARLV
jgi:hypothetical protein